ncbi:hypothetical protein Y032_0154g3017 [Ancylostoma ceylanicum]|uniref:Uncharacterized protein n=1 Tax=Ancylostoma ceylanicum TaxID=53326 RepID=A0A016T063_9BILA|nr:hypothetical protein Y032_0154g3017 [Ancylostoma ceylanicum]
MAIFSRTFMNTAPDSRHTELSTSYRTMSETVCDAGNCRGITLYVLVLKRCFPMDGMAHFTTVVPISACEVASPQFFPAALIFAFSLTIYQNQA